MTAGMLTQSARLHKLKGPACRGKRAVEGVLLYSLEELPLMS
jgi:hypothetical protein